MVVINLNNIDKIYKGSQEITKIYKGNTLIYPIPPNPKKFWLKGDDLTDSSGNNLNPIQWGGNPIIADSSKKKYGSASLKFDGTNFLSVKSDKLIFGTQDFTIEFWLNSTDLTRGYIGQGSKDTNIYNTEGIIAPFVSAISIYSSSNRVALNSNTTTLSSPSINTWSHYAVCRKSNSVYSFLNGIKANSLVLNTNFLSNILIIGTRSSTTNSSYRFIGNIDSLQVNIGLAKYENSFNPETDTGLAY